jgi:hypothetical protein
MREAPEMTPAFIALFIGNFLVAGLLVTMLATYMLRYFWWRRAEGRILVASMLCMLSVISAGLFERFGQIVIHNILAAAGYWGASVVLLTALRHVWQLTNGPDVAVEHRDNGLVSAHPEDEPTP